MAISNRSETDLSQIALQFTWLLAGCLMAACPLPAADDFQLRPVIRDGGRVGEAWRLTGDELGVTKLGLGLAIGGDVMVIRAEAAGISEPCVICERIAGEWTPIVQVAPLTAGSDHRRLAIDGGRVAISSKQAVHLYEKLDGTWTLVQTIGTSTLVVSDIAMRDDRLIVGFAQYGQPASMTGRADTYVRTRAGWTFEATIACPNPVAGRRFGTAVALDGQFAVVGAPKQQASSPPWPGAAYRFALVGGAWQLTDTFSPPELNSGAQFGAAISCDEGRILIGAPKAANAYGASSGLAFLFEPSLAGWTRYDLAGETPRSSDGFGTTLALHAQTAVVGMAPISVVSDPGAATIFRRTDLGWMNDGGGWPTPFRPAIYSTPTVTSFHAGIGEAVAIDVDDVVVGAPKTQTTSSHVEGLVYGVREGSPDCDGDGLADGATLLGSFTFESGVLTPFWGGIGYDIVLPAQPSPAGPVRITVVARVEDVPAQIYLSGHFLGFSEGGTGCLGVGDPRQFVLTPEEYLAFTGGAEPVVRVSSFPFPGSNTCEDLSFAEFTVQYPVAGEVLDLDLSGRPDACDDCDGNGMPDVAEILAGRAVDCDGNWSPDACDGAASADCDGDGVADACAIAAGIVADCNANEIPDGCDLAAGVDSDCDGDGVPDTCGLLAASSHQSDGKQLAGFMQYTNGFRLQLLRTTPQTTSIRALRVMWKAAPSTLMPPPTTPCWLLLYSDPNGDGQPDDATLLAGTSTEIGSPEPDIFYDYMIPETPIGPARTTFFVGVYAEFATPAESWMVAADPLPDELQTAWFGNAYPLPLYQVPSLAGVFLVPVRENIPPLAWMIRALGPDAVACFHPDPADLDHDGDVDALDLALLLGAWGSAGQGDLDADGIVSSGDLAILLGAWTG